MAAKDVPATLMNGSQVGMSLAEMPANEPQVVPDALMKRHTEVLRPGARSASALEVAQSQEDIMRRLREEISRQPTAGAVQ